MNRENLLKLRKVVEEWPAEFLWMDVPAAHKSTHNVSFIFLAFQVLTKDYFADPNSSNEAMPYLSDYYGLSDDDINKLFRMLPLPRAIPRMSTTEEFAAGQRSREAFDLLPPAARRGILLSALDGLIVRGIIDWHAARAANGVEVAA